MPLNLPAPNDTYTTPDPIQMTEALIKGLGLTYDELAAITGLARGDFFNWRRPNVGRAPQVCAGCCVCMPWRALSSTDLVQPKQPSGCGAAPYRPLINLPRASSRMWRTALPISCSRSPRSVEKSMAPLCRRPMSI